VHELLPGTAQLKGGYLYVSDKPGLGIDLREDLAAKHPFVDSRPGPGMGDRAIDGSLVKP
jgi:mannonate dehydratase